jgi:hypothetical protein
MQILQLSTNPQGWLCIRQPVIVEEHSSTHYCITLKTLVASVVNEDLELFID